MPISKTTIRPKAETNSSSSLTKISSQNLRNQEPTLSTLLQSSHPGNPTTKRTWDSFCLTLLSPSTNLLPSMTAAITASAWEITSLKSSVLPLKSNALRLPSMKPTRRSRKSRTSATTHSGLTVSELTSSKKTSEPNSNSTINLNTLEFTPKRKSTKANISL